MRKIYRLLDFNAALRIFVSLSALIGFCAVSFAVYAMWEEHKTYWFIFLPFPAVLLWGGLVGWHRICDIAVTEHGLATTSFGRIWKTIRWQDISLIEIRSVQPSAFAANALSEYRVYGRRGFKFWFCEPVQFTERVERFEELLGVINQRIANGHVEIIDLRDQDAGPVRITRLT